MNIWRDRNRCQILLSRIGPVLAVTGGLVQLIYLWVGLSDLPGDWQALNSKLPDLAGGSYCFWDPLAAGLLADESLGYVKEGRVKVYPDPGPSSGLTRLIESGAPMRYTVSANRQRFELEFLRALNQP